MNPETSPTGSRRKLLLAVAALAVLAAAAWGWRAWRGGGGDAAGAAPRFGADRGGQRPGTQSAAPGRHRRADHGAVVAVPVRQGQAVTAGQLLIELQAAEARGAGEAGRLGCDSGPSAAAPAARSAGARGGAGTAPGPRHAGCRPCRRRTQRGPVPPGLHRLAALDEARKALEVAGGGRESARKQWESGQPSGSAMRWPRPIWPRPKRAWTWRARLRYTRITAPRAGTLIDRNVEVGDVVQPGKTLMVLSPEGQTQLVVDLDERHLRRLALGQAALASADAFPGQRFAATLAYINPGVNAQTGSVQVKLDVPQPPPNLAQDMTVSVDIEIARRPQALVIGLDAVHEPDGPAPWVLKLQDGRAKQQAVRLGLKAGGVAEVLDGLQAGDTLVTGPEAVRDGQRVRARATPVR